MYLPAVCLCVTAFKKAKGQLTPFDCFQLLESASYKVTKGYTATAFRGRHPAKGPSETGWVDCCREDHGKLTVSNVNTGHV